MSTILVIDDNKDYRAGFIEILELEAYKTLEAENGLIGLQMIHQYSPNLILCDVDMPVMNGIEVLRRVKADPILAKIPFVIITGQSEEQTLKTSHELGADAYLTKPIPVNDFLVSIVHFLNAKALH